MVVLLRAGTDTLKLDPPTSLTKISSRVCINTIEDLFPTHYYKPPLDHPLWPSRRAVIADDTGVDTVICSMYEFLMSHEEHFSSISKKEA